MTSASIGRNDPPLSPALSLSFLERTIDRARAVLALVVLRCPDPRYCPPPVRVSKWGQGLSPLYARDRAITVPV